MGKSIILLIDDCAGLRENTAELLTLAGYSVSSAEDGKKGLEMIKNTSPDLILCDILMPELDGYGVLRAIKNMPQMVGIPFIFMTAKSENTDLRKGMNLGADDYLVKPFKDDDLLEAVNTHLEKKRQIKEKFEKSGQKMTALLENGNDYKSIFAASPYKICRKVKAKQMIYIEGDTVNHVFCLQKGKTKTFKSNDDGKGIITGLYKDGDIFGLASFMEDIQKESCTAIEESEILSIPKEEFLQIIDSHADIAWMLIKSLSSQYLGAEDKMLKLAYNSSRKKIADALLFYNLNYKEREQDEFPFDRGDIAEIAGVAKESVSRTLSCFNEEGLITIDTKNGNVKIQDYKKLETL